MVLAIQKVFNITPYYILHIKYGTRTTRNLDICAYFLGQTVGNHQEKKNEKPRGLEAPTKTARRPKGKKKIWFFTNLHYVSKWYLLIHSDAPQARSVVIIVFTHLVRPSVRPYICPHFSKSSKTKQISSENNVYYWRDCGSGRVDHWWHLSSSSFRAWRLVLVLLRKLAQKRFCMFSFRGADIFCFPFTVANWNYAQWVIRRTFSNLYVFCKNILYYIKQNLLPVWQKIQKKEKTVGIVLDYFLLFWKMSLS